MKLNISRVNYKTVIGPFDNIRTMTVLHEKVDAELVTLAGWEDIKMFIARTLHKIGYKKRRVGQWYLYDYLSGMNLGWGHKEKENVVTDNIVRINEYGKAKYMELVLEHINKFGAANY